MAKLIKQKYAPSYYEEILNTLGKEKTNLILNNANKIYNNLLIENKDLSNKVKSHTDKMIFPAIAVYKAIQ